MVSQTLIEELKQQKIWLIYFKTITKNGNTTKSPRSAKNTATGADKAHADTLATYDEAVAAMKLYEADGVGLVIPEDYFLLDIDHRELSDPFVQMMLARFDTYTEYSPSGNGIHILGKLDRDKLPIYYDEKNSRYRLDSAYYYKNSKLNLEIYPGCATARFSTFTGNMIKDLPLKDCTQALLTTFDKEMRKKEKVRYSYERDGDKAAFDIICNLRKQKNADKFIKLYDKGDFSDYGSQSEADAALCTMIAFRTGDDPEMMDEIFRTSALMRDKWERDDYRVNTIRYAIDSLDGQFHKAVRSRPPFILYDEAKGREYVIPNLLAQYVREHLNYVLVRDDGRHALMKYVYEDGYYQYHADDMMKGRMQNAPEHWQIFEHHHEAIIDQETFDIVQRIREGRRRLTPMGEMPILSGMLFCADCGAKLYQVRHRGWEHDKEHFVCATYRKVKGRCSSHQIRNVVVEEILLDEIRRITAYAREHENEFVEMAMSKSAAALNKSQREGKRELEQATARIQKLDTIIQKLYEDNIEGKISDERFSKMSDSYENEQKQLEARIAVLKSQLATEKDIALNTKHFLDLVRRYTDIQELDAENHQGICRKDYRVQGRAFRWS